MTDDAPAPPDAETLFALQKTHLSVTAAEFRRGNEDGTFLTRIPLSEIDRVEFRRPFNPFCLIFLAAAAGVTAIGYFLAEANWLRVTLYVVGLLLGLFGLAGVRADSIQLDRRGERKRFDCLEGTDEVAAFAESLKELTERR